VKALHEGLPFSQFELVAGAGHMLPLECPEAVGLAVAHFLSSLAPLTQ